MGRKNTNIIGCGNLSYAADQVLSASQVVKQDRKQWLLDNPTRHPTKQELDEYFNAETYMVPVSFKVPILFRDVQVLDYASAGWEMYCVRKTADGEWMAMEPWMFKRPHTPDPKEKRRKFGEYFIKNLLFYRSVIVTQEIQRFFNGPISCEYLGLEGDSIIIKVSGYVKGGIRNPRQCLYNIVRNANKRIRTTKVSIHFV